ncbi:MAG: YqaA family protein [Gammaproteobacteria bacterium]
MEVADGSGVLGLWGLFVSAFLSASLLPGGSEVLLYALAAGANLDPWLLLLVASAGNTLGGMSSWLLGRVLAWRWPDHRLIRQPRYQGALARLRRWGCPLLLLSWVPLLGDPLCVVAGWLRMAFWPSLLFIAMGKVLRYTVVLMLV